MILNDICNCEKNIGFFNLVLVTNGNKNNYKIILEYIKNYINENKYYFSDISLNNGVYEIIFDTYIIKKIFIRDNKVFEFENIVDLYPQFKDKINSIIEHENNVNNKIMTIIKIEADPHRMIMSYPPQQYYFLFLTDQYLNEYKIRLN